MKNIKKITLEILKFLGFILLNMIYAGLLLVVLSKTVGLTMSVIFIFIITYSTFFVWFFHKMFEEK